MSDSVRSHRRQPTRLPRPWDSPGKNTGVGCHFLLQCMKVESEREVAQSCLTPSDPMDCSPPGSSVHGIFQARVPEWGAIAFSIHSIIYKYCISLLSLYANWSQHELVLLFQWPYNRVTNWNLSGCNTGSHQFRWSSFSNKYIGSKASGRSPGIKEWCLFLFFAFYKKANSVWNSRLRKLFSLWREFS